MSKPGPCRGPAAAVVGEQALGVQLRGLIGQIVLGAPGEELSPRRAVATLHLPAQNAYSDARRRYADDVLSFNPWHALEAHRPLGSIMRSAPPRATRASSRNVALARR